MCYDIREMLYTHSVTYVVLCMESSGIYPGGNYPGKGRVIWLFSRGNQLLYLGIFQ